MSAEYEEERQDSRPFVMRQNVQVLEHFTNPADDEKQLQRVYFTYPELRDPNLHYTNIPDEKQLMASKIRLRNVIDLRYGSGKRRHTQSDLADKHLAYILTDLKLNRGLRGFERKQANTTNVNQNQIVTQEVRRRGGSIWKPWTWGR